MQIKWLGHSGFRIDDLIVDAWTKEIPGFGLKNNYQYSASDTKGANVVCSSHKHDDHYLGSFEIAKETGATFVAGFELAVEAMQAGCKVEMLNHGGSAIVAGWKINIVPALHSATSNPNGFVFRKSGKTIYHAGDTALIDEMKEIGKKFSIDVALLPIGGKFTMDAKGAVKAAKALKPKIVIPMHYNTFPMIMADANEFKKIVEKETASKVIVLNLGESIEI